MFYEEKECKVKLDRTEASMLSYVWDFKTESKEKIYWDQRIVWTGTNQFGCQER